MPYLFDNLFEDEPIQWGLRGDPHLWREMRLHFQSISAALGEKEFESALNQAFEKLTGQPLNFGEKTFVKRYSSGGMSSGQVSHNFWCETAVPLLKKRLRDSQS